HCSPPQPYTPSLHDALPISKLERKTTPAPARSQSSDDSGSVIEKYIDANPLTSTLERYGYVRKGKSRYLSPYSSTGLPGVILFEDRKSTRLNSSHVKISYAV